MGFRLFDLKRDLRLFVLLLLIGSETAFLINLIDGERKDLSFNKAATASSKVWAQPKDIKGWSKARWGMTEDEIVKVFGKQVERLPNPIQPTGEKGHSHTNLWIKALDIGSKQFEVYFRIKDENNKLGFINIVPKEKPSFILFKFLEQKLVEEYGPPTKYEAPNVPNISVQTHESLWIFPTTTIQLQYIDLSDSQMLHLNYYPTKLLPNQRRG